MSLDWAHMAVAANVQDTEVAEFKAAAAACVAFVDISDLPH